MYNFYISEYIKYLIKILILGDNLLKNFLVREGAAEHKRNKKKLRGQLSVIWGNKFGIDI
jgi:hypothetical protein